MSTKQTFDDLRRNVISRFEALDFCLKLTEKDVYRLNLLLNDLGQYLNNSKTDFEVIISCCFEKHYENKEDKVWLEEFRRKHKGVDAFDINYREYLKPLKYPIVKTCSELLNEFFDEKSDWQNIDWLLNWQGVFLEIIESNNFDNLNDIPKTKENEPDFESVFYPNEFTTLYQLKNDLLKYCEPQQPEPQPEPKKKQAKDVWGLVARYNFLENLGVLDKLNKLSENDKSKVISQILGCNFDNAKKLKNGVYQRDETQTEQLERKQLIDLIKRTQTD